MENLQDVQRALRNVLDSDASFSFVNTRLILRTGVDLKVISPRHAEDPRAISKVIAALREMGYDLAAKDSAR